MELATSHHERACPWKLTQQGAPALCALGLKRCLTASRQFLIRLLKEKELTIAEIREAVGSGNLQSLSGLQAATNTEPIGDLCPGSLAIKLDTSGPPFAVVAELTEDMLELAVRN